MHREITELGYEIEKDDVPRPNFWPKIKPRTKGIWKHPKTRFNVLDVTRKQKRRKGQKRGSRKQAFSELMRVDSLR